MSTSAGDGAADGDKKYSVRIKLEVDGNLPN